VSLIVRKEKKFLWPIITLILFIAVMGFTAYRTMHRAYTTVNDLFKPRTGMEVYTAVLGKPKSCVQVRHFFDPTVPVMDDLLLLHVSTCPEEIERITSIRQYKLVKTTPSGCAYSQAYMTWWELETLGDSIWVYDGIDQSKMHGPAIITNLDQTEAYCLDM
jgi:hypothetical protein